jgi:26S proteasome regulatory subunit N1
MEDQADELREIMNNSRLSQNFLNLARELDIMEPKVPEDVYKTHLESTGWLYRLFDSL